MQVIYKSVCFIIVARDRPSARCLHAELLHVCHLLLKGLTRLLDLLVPELRGCVGTQLKLSASLSFLYKSLMRLPCSVAFDIDIDHFCFVVF